MIRRNLVDMAYNDNVLPGNREALSKVSGIFRHLDYTKIGSHHSKKAYELGENISKLLVIGPRFWSTYATFGQRKENGSLSPIVKKIPPSTQRQSRKNGSRQLKQRVPPASSVLLLGTAKHDRMTCHHTTHRRTLPSHHLHFRGQPLNR